MKAAEFSRFIERVAMKAGLKVQAIDSGMIHVPYRLADGRTQLVYVRPRDLVRGALIVEFFSPVLQIPQGQMLGQKMANRLLRQNASLPHGGWAIMSQRDADYLGVIDTQIAQTMDPPEFAESAGFLANLADEKEKELAIDDAF